MNRAAAGAFVAFIVTIALAPVVRRICIRANLFDRPGKLTIHARPIPRLGGIAIFFGIVAGMLASGTHDFLTFWPLSAALALIWFTGLFDDIRGLHPLLRLVAQVAAALLLYLGGWRIPAFTSGPLAILILCFFVVLFVNSFNFCDGADGIATGVACVVSLSYLALPRTALTILGVEMAAVTAAACAAFLSFNFSPASLFLGDSGSTLLGCSAALLALEAPRAHAGAGKFFLFSFAAAALPLFDAVRVVLQRTLHGTSPLHGDRRHFYDVLLAKGWRVRRVAVSSWAVTALSAGSGILIVRFGAPQFWLLAPLFAIAIWVLAVTAERPKRALASPTKADAL
jgi:UDP-GlcNAc:undecaprenyl-phosphate/decaprenyl-phosphate GlcNAc-1-phosphate transferase